jgi:uncharacterized protein (DUF169 family)
MDESHYSEVRGTLADTPGSSSSPLAFELAERDEELLKPVETTGMKIRCSQMLTEATSGRSLVGHSQDIGCPAAVSAFDTYDERETQSLPPPQQGCELTIV